MCTKWSNLEDWFIATIAVSLLAVRTVKSFLVQPCKHFDPVQIKQLKTETRIVRLQKGYRNISVKPDLTLFEGHFSDKSLPIAGKKCPFVCAFLVVQK